MIWFLAYAAAGAFVGLLAGMLGIGGGMTLVPILAALFEAQSLAPSYGVHLALGTAMASAVVTAAASVRAHHVRGAVDWRIAVQLAPGMVLGSMLSSAASGWIPASVARRQHAGDRCTNPGHGDASLDGRLRRNVRRELAQVHRTF